LLLWIYDSLLIFLIPYGGALDLVNHFSLGCYLYMNAVVYSKKNGRLELLRRCIATMHACFNVLIQVLTVFPCSAHAVEQEYPTKLKLPSSQYSASAECITEKG
jgi:hypothetical protein